MSDFSSLKRLTIPEGVVTQIADESGAVIWAAGNDPVILEVEKITADTYAGETTYTAEEFILLDIYPKTNGTVKVTYGGLTKTITDTSGAEEPNAQQVYFGTFNGVSDSVATPASGELVIEGGYKSFAVGFYANSIKGATEHCGCITAVNDWGDVVDIPNFAFYGCASLASIVIPDGVTSIGASAFYQCTSLESINIPEGVTDIGAFAFGTGTSSAKMKDGKITLPSTLQSIYFSALSYNFKGAQADEYYWYFAEVVMLATTPPTLIDDEIIRPGLFLKKIIVPKGCGEAYKAAEGWVAFENYIVEAS